MPQVRKPEIDRRIRAAALQRFAAHGYEHTSMAAIAATAGVSPANLYRYHPDGKRALFDRVLPDEVADAHEKLVTERVEALLLPHAPAGDAAGDPVGHAARDPVGHAAREPGGAGGPAAARLLDFWIDHRLEVVILLGRTDGTRLAGYGGRFVGLLTDLAVRRLRAGGADPGPDVLRLLTIIFDNTRRALVAILAAHEEPDAIRRAIEGFWSYQLPGLDGFYRWASP